MVRAKTWLISVVVLAVPGVAHADGGYVTFGPLLSFGTGYERTTGFGGEVSYMYYPWRDMVGLGGFFQSQSYGSHSRHALGAQLGGYVGLEGGVAMVTKGDEHATSWGPHLGIFSSIGLAGAALRLTFPVVTSDHGDIYGVEAGLTLTIKLFVPHGSPPPNIRMPSGRPLTVDGSVVTACVVQCEEWV